MWIIIGVVGAGLFAILVTLLLNTPEALLKTIIDENEIEKEQAEKEK